jgi:hypothetical protein
VTAIDGRFAEQPWSALDAMAVAGAAEFGDPNRRAVERALDRLTMISEAYSTRLNHPTFVRLVANV